MRFEGKRVLITGAASGVGMATAALFAAEGADLLALDVTAAEGVTVCDLTDSARVTELVRAGGPFDIVLNIAGIVRLDHIAELSLETWQRHLDVNLKAGLVMLTKSMALELSKTGVRVNCVCPGGINTPLLGGVARTMPTDLDDDLMARLYNPLPPGFAEPDEIAEAIAYLASDAARSITGSALSIDGGTLS